MSEVEAAIAALRRGALAVIPTDTVYGLAASAADERATRALYETKGRAARRPTAILFASGLSFLGLGVQPPEPEWGAMLSRGRELLRSSPLGAMAPGVAITLVVLSFSIVGDGLKDALDPTQVRTGADRCG